MSTYTVRREETFETVRCYRCDIEFGLPQTFKHRRQSDKAQWWCPNGHSQVFCGESDADMAKRLERDLAQMRDVVESNRVAAMKATAEMKRAQAETKRLANRVQNGVCPCCNRSFANLRRHMATKHPRKAP